jgi:hypothetical protein
MGAHTQVLVRVVEPRRYESAGSVQRACQRPRSVQNLAVRPDGEDAVVADGNRR